MKKLIFITPRAPTSLVTGDRIRSFNILRQLSKEYQIFLVVLEGCSDEEKFENINGYCEEIFYLKKHSSFQKTYNLLKALMFQKSLQNSLFYRPELKFLLREHEFDIAYFHLTRSLDNFRFVKATKYVLDMCDPVSLTYDQLDKSLSWTKLWKWIARWELRRNSALEKMAVNKFDLTLVHVMNDASKAQLDMTKMGESTMGVDSKNLGRRFSRDITAGRLFFIGNLNYPPNNDGVEWFLENVFPILPSYFSIDLIGGGGDKLCSKYSSQRVRFHGLLLDCKEIAENASVGLAPIFIATGIQNKVLEYISSGMPVLTTYAVASNLDPSLRDHVAVLERKPEVWVSALNNLSYDEHATRSASKFVDGLHDWDEIGRKIVSVSNKVGSILTNE